MLLPLTVRFQLLILAPSDSCKTWAEADGWAFLLGPRLALCQHTGQPVFGTSGMSQPGQTPRVGEEGCPVCTGQGRGTAFNLV